MSDTPLKEQKTADAPASTDNPAEKKILMRIKELETQAEECRQRDKELMKQIEEHNELVLTTAKEGFEKLTTLNKEAENAPQAESLRLRYQARDLGNKLNSESARLHQITMELEEQQRINATKWVKILEELKSLKKEK